MASHYWLGTTSTNPATAANWSLESGGAPSATAPGSADAAIFDGGGVAPCTLAGNTAWGSLTILAAYASKLDLADSAYTLTITDGGSITLDGGEGSEFDCGTAFYSITNGTFDNKDQTTFTRGTSTLVLNGTCTIIGHSSKYLFNATISIGAVVTLSDTTTNYVRTYGELVVNGSLIVADVWSCSGTMVMGADGSITHTGTGGVVFSDSTSGEGITTRAVGSLFSAPLEITHPNAGAVFAAGTYGDLTISQTHASNSYTLRLNGTYIFTGNVAFENDDGGTLIIDNATYDPNIEIRGNVTWTNTGGGTLTYTKGDGTLTAGGASNQSWDFEDKAIEDLIIDKSAGTLTFADGFTADTVDHQAGAVDPNGQVLASAGDWRMGSAASLADPESSTFTIGGDAIWYGSRYNRLNLTGSAAWNLDCTGSGTIRYADIDYCEADGGSEVNAEVGCTDGGHNVNLVFAEPSVHSETKWRRDHYLRP